LEYEKRKKILLEKKKKKNLGGEKPLFGQQEFDDEYLFGEIGLI